LRGADEPHERLVHVIEFKGWVRSSLIDYPGKIAAVFFTGGCNFRCPMCHNQDLVERSATLPSLDLAEVGAFLKRRAGKLTGVVITGGEPTLQPGLQPFLLRVREMGYAIKLDTNGYRPDVLHELLDAGLLDALAFDVKAPSAKYAALAGVTDVECAIITRSMALIAAAGVPCEYRTTVVPGWLDADDIEAIARWIDEEGAGAPSTYILQQFRGAQTLSPALAGARPYPVVELEAMAARARQWVADVRLRGI
jgi:pyruvate formate lyase activating enzyme